MGRFVRPEAIEGTVKVTRVFDQVHVVHRACRSVDPEEGNLEDVRDRLRRLARVTHGHLARLVAVGEEDGRLMVVSEWLPGGPLARSHIPNPGRLLPGVAEALYALHRHGLAHGSVSVSSFLLDGSDQVKLVDACIREGSVPEDIEAFGRAMEELYAGREMPPELLQVAQDAQAGRYGDATLLAQAVQAVCAALPPVAGADPGGAPAPVVAPAPEEQEEDRPLAFWLFLALLPAAALLWGALLSGWLSREPEAPILAPVELRTTHPPAPAAAPEPEPEPEPEVPAPELLGGGHAASAPVAPAGAGGAPAPMPAPYVEGMAFRTDPVAGDPEPALTAHVAVARPEPAPPPPPAPPPATGSWRKVVQAGDQHPTLVLVLDATNTVEDRLGRKGRPRIEIRCAEHRLSVVLLPGVSAVEHTLNEVGLEVVTASAKFTSDRGITVPEQLRIPDPDRALLVFPNPGRWVNTLAASDRIDASYTPFASAAVVARFETAGLPHLLPDIRENCSL